MPVVWATLCLFLFVIHFSFEFCRSSSKKYRVFFKLASNLRNQKKERWFRFKIRERLRLFPHHMMLFPYLVSQLLLKQAMAAFSQDKSQSILFQIQLINTNSKVKRWKKFTRNLTTFFVQDDILTSCLFIIVYKTTTIIIPDLMKFYRWF